jgi:hypothetical protein
VASCGKFVGSLILRAWTIFGFGSAKQTEAIRSQRKKQEALLDSIYEKTDGWYFAEETWADEHGPFSSRAKASFEQAKYCVLNELSDVSWVYIDPETEFQKECSHE